MPVILSPAALGFKVHTGWAAVVAIALTPGRSGAALALGHIDILLRRRIELLPIDSGIVRFAYHRAAELPPAQGAKLIERTTRAAGEAADAALSSIFNELRSLPVRLDSAGVPAGSRSAPANLPAILASHAFIHAAEGALFQDAVAHACERRGLAVMRSRGRDFLAELADREKQHIAGLRKLIGPPWGADHKAAAALALVALRNHRGRPANVARG